MSVREMTIKDFVEISAILRALQLFSVKEMLRCDRPMELEIIRQLHVQEQELREDPWKCFELNLELHTKIIDFIKNKRMTTMAQNMSDSIMLAGYASSSWNFEYTLGQVFEEHEDIIHALEARDLEAFEEALRRHDENGLKRMLR